MAPQWLRWAKMLQTMARTGLTYAKDPYDEECYASAKNRRSSCSTGSGWPPLSVFHAAA